MVRKNPKGGVSALRLEFYCTAQSVADLEYWNRQARQLRNGKKTGIWRKGDLQLDFRYGIMNLVDLQGRVWTANEWDLLHNGVEAKARTVAESEHRKDMQENAEVACAAGPDTERASEPTLTAEASRVNEVEANAYKVPEPIEAPAVPGGGPRDQPSTVHEMLLSLIKKLTADQRRILAGELRAVEADMTIDQNRKAELAISFINKLRGDEARASEETSDSESLGEQRSMLEEQTQPDEEMPESAGIDDDAQGGALLDLAEEQPDRLNLSVGEVVSSGVDIDNGKQDMGVLAPLGEQQGKEIAEECEKRQSCAGENHDQLLPEVMAVSSGSNTRGVDDVWGGYTDSCYRVFEERIGDFGAIDTQDITKGDLMGHSGQGLGDLIDFGGMKEASVSHGVVQVFGDEVGGSVKGQPVFMDDLELEEPVILGKIEIGVDVGGPDVVNEHLEFSDTERSKENPVVGGLSEISGITITDIIAGDDVKAKDIGKSGDFQAGDAIRDDSVVSIMSMNYKGCCIQEGSLEAQRQGHGVVDYDYDYGGGVSSAKFKYGRPAFATGEIGMFVVTGRPPGRLIGG